MIMCVLLCYPVSCHMLQLLLTGRAISSLIYKMGPKRSRNHMRKIPQTHLQSLSLEIELLTSRGTGSKWKRGGGRRHRNNRGRRGRKPGGQRILNRRIISQTEQ